MMWTLLRTPKMYGAIFGFQRRVWWPKWTPASRSWRMVNVGIAMGNVLFRLLRRGRGPPMRTPERAAGMAADGPQDPREVLRRALDSPPTGFWQPEAQCSGDILYSTLNAPFIQFPEHLTKECIRD